MKGLKTNYSYVLLFLLAVLLPTNAAAQSYRTRGGEILNCFGWTYKQINDHLQDIKDAEFSAIQVSSVQPMLPKDTKELWYTVGGEKQGVTIYVKKDRDTAPYLYANTTDWKQLSGAWPGKQMYKTCTIGEQDYWYETFKVDGLNIIFNDGKDLKDDELKKKSQTENITNVTSDTFYRLYTNTGADREYAYEPLSGITAPTKHVSVYAKATEAPYLNVWGNGINGNGNMPGAQMWKTEDIDGTKYYYDSFAAETINYSFNDGVGDGSGNYTEGTNKTADITNITATKYYKVQKPGAFEVTEEDRITIYCKASKAPYLWAWNDKGNLTGDKWPGIEMTQTTTINGETFYYKTFKTDKINITFSGGKEQTDDVKEIKADSYFEYDIEKSQGNNLTQVTPGITIYCKATSAPYIWAWDPQDNSKKYTGDSWPGQQMEGPTTIDGESYYYTTFDVANISFLLNNGNGGQTADITNVTSNRYFEYDGAETAEDIEDHTLYVKVSGDIPYLYVWKDGGTELLDGFPGQQLSTTTTIDGETYYTYNFKGKINFIINSNGKQSGDLSADRNKFYSVSNITTYAATELTGINEPSNVYAPSWAFIYEPLGIRMGDNLLGTVNEFKELVTNAHAKGLGVVVGVEANSVSNKEDLLDDNITKYLRKDYDGTEDWDMENREWITHHNVNVHTGVDYTCDLKTEDTELQDIVISFLKDLADAGVDGICWYHAKYIGVEQGHSYFNEAKGVPKNPDLSHNNLEGDTFWENICNYWWTEKGKWCYGEIGADPFYKGNTDDPNHFECKWSHEDGYSRIVREYIFQMDLADAFYAKKNFTDGGCSWANGYWEAQTAEQAKLRKSMTITEFLDNKKTAGKSDLVYYAENADTYMQIWPEINGKSGGELYSSYDSKWDNQGVADRAYARVAGQDGATIVYFARPESPTSEIAPDELGSRALHFKTSRLVKQLNKYHRIMNGYGEYITDNSEDGPGARASLCREQGAIVIKRWPDYNNTQDQDVVIANGGSRTAAGTYTDKVSGNTFTINEKTITGRLGDTGVAVLYDEQMVASQLAIVTPPSPNGEESFSNGGTITVTSQLANYNLQVQWSNNSSFSNYSGKARQQTIAAGSKEPCTIDIDKTYAGSNYHTWIYLRYRAVDPNNSRRYGNWQYHYYDLRNEDNKSSDESSIFHILYFKIPEQLEQADKETEREAFLDKFKVYSWADQGNQAVVLTRSDGNPMPHPLTDKEIAEGKKVSDTWYRPVDLVYEGGDPEQIGSDGDTSYSDFVGNKKEYDPELGGSYCDVVTYAGQQFYRMTIGTPNFNFNVVNVQCNYDGKLLDTWTVDDDAFFDIQMDSYHRVSVAPLRSIVGDAVYNVGGFDNGKVNFMDYSPKESTTTDKVYTYTGQFQKGKEFRIVAPIDYQNNYMYDHNDDETCYKKYLKVYQTTQGVQIGGSSKTSSENKLKFKSTYTQTQGKYQEAGENSLSDAQNPTFNLPTGLYTIKLHEVTTYNESSGLSETVPYYEVMRPKVSVDGINNTTVSMVVDNETDPKWWKADITVSDQQAVKGNKIVIRDVDDSSLFTPLEYQVDTPDDGLTGEALYKNYSEAGTYRVKHEMGYKQKSGEGETSVPAQDKLYLGFNLSKVGNGEAIKDTQGNDWSGYWGSFSDGKARKIPAGATAYAVSGFEKKKNGGSEEFRIFLEEVKGTVPAETPLLLYYKDSDRSGIADINIDVPNDAAHCTFFMTTGDNPKPVGKKNWLAAQVAISNADRFKEYPNYQSPYTQNPDNNNYVLSYQTVKGEKVLGFFKVTKFPPENLQFRKAFLSIPKATEARAVPLYWDAIMDFTNGVATSVSGLERGIAESQAFYYNLQGIKVEKPTHGIYIRNGKKVIIK